MRDVYKGEVNLSIAQDSKFHGLKTNFNHHLKIMQKELGIKTNVINHKARHIFAQRLFLSGAIFHNIRMALGHSSLQIPENYREQLVTDEVRDVTQQFFETPQDFPN